MTKPREHATARAPRSTHDGPTGRAVLIVAQLSVLILLVSLSFVLYVDRFFPIYSRLERLEQDLLSFGPPRRLTRAVATTTKRVLAISNPNHHHDRNSTFSYMLLRGEPFDSRSTGGGGGRDDDLLPPYSPLDAPDDARSTTNKPNITFDALTVGSANNFDLIRAQADTWGSHRSIRYFFAATEEDDDGEPTCQNFVNDTETMVAISDHCHSRSHRNNPRLRHSPVHQYWNNRYAYAPFLMSRGPGWICAQKRFAFALRKMGRFYRREELQTAGREEEEAADTNNTNIVLPDYVLLQDDDTFYNTALLEEYLRTQRDSSIAFAEAGCLIRAAPVEQFNFTFPWGGFGFVLSRAAVERLIRPIYCNSSTSTSTPPSSEEEDNDDDEHAFVRHVCRTLEDDYLGERVAFIDGMSVSDLMGAHAEREPFSDFKHWDPGYCLHGDWVVGYYINYYHITEQPHNVPWHKVVRRGDALKWRDVPTLRIASTFGEFNGTKDTLNCRNSDERRCLGNKEAVFCHRQSADSMKTKFDSHLAATGALDKFRVRSS